ncbi:MAG TPA: ATP-binding cassette domain-containing protein [Thermoanaerobaculia bacterium]|nr:ATP-binding cassette domain-containing protein [Thermoanaerobaculia bacterium]
MTGARTLLRLERVGYRYEGDVALRDVELEIARGERLAVLGPNGGGKTTLLTLLLGLRDPSEGRVVRASPNGDLRLGYVPQFPAFDRNFPIRVDEMVLEGRLRERRAGGTESEDRAELERILERLDLVGLRRVYLTELSGGELKRALVARALVARPELLVLDEPTASLDESSRRTFWTLVAEQPETTAIVLATHDLAPATFAPTRALFVDRTVRELALGDLHAEAAVCGHGHD